jgi:hypothetical protein
MKIKITLVLILSICLNTVGQSSEAMAKYHFLEAQNAYGNGDNNTALTNLQSCVEALTKTNSKIEALYTYIYLNKKEYLKAKKHMTLYFDIASEDHSDYMKMIALLKQIKNKTKEAKLEKIRLEKVFKLKIKQDQQNWETAISQKTTASFQKYLQNTKNVLYSLEARKYLKHSAIKTLVLSDRGDLSKMINYNIPIGIEGNQWGIINITDLKSIKYYFNVTSMLADELPYLPKEIGNLLNLEELKLIRSSLTKLPESIGKLINLKSLIITNTPIEEILPKSIGSLVNLEELHIRNNFSLTKLPESIGNLVSLKTLNLFNSKITLLPESIGNLVSLKTLNLYNSKITLLPESIGKLINLKALIIGITEITSLPESIGTLVNLEELSLSFNNSLTKLPESIGKLINLKTLNIGMTEIISLPESISNINNLQILFRKADSKRLKKSIKRIQKKNKTIKFTKY